MRWMDKPRSSACSTSSLHGSHKLAGPERMAEPVCEVGDFDGPGSPEPGCGVAGSEIPARYLRTVARSRSSSRAIRRLDQPCLCSVRMLCCRFTLSWYIEPSVPEIGTPRPNASPQKWLVLTRNSLAGFARKLTLFQLYRLDAPHIHPVNALRTNS